MDIIKNLNGKTVCHVDPKNKTVEIVTKGILTTIKFLSDNTYEITNLKITQ